MPPVLGFDSGVSITLSQPETVLGFGYPSLFTLDDLYGITRFDACSFMGVAIAGKCDPPALDARDSIVKAVQTAIDMMNDLLETSDYHLEDQQQLLKGSAPYFYLNKQEPVTIITTEYDGSVAYPVSPTGLRCDEIATITANITALETNETFLDARIIFPDCILKRLGVEFCGVYLTGQTLTLKTKAYNLIDLDNAGDNHADDTMPYLDTVRVAVRTQKPSVPLVYWQTKSCSCGSCAEFTSTNACINQDGREANLYNVSGIIPPTNENCCSHRHQTSYALNVVRRGVYRPALADSIVSLMNCLLPENLCSCNPITNQRWADDNGNGPKWASTYRYSFWNPFGIASPGAQKAWKSIQKYLGGARAWIG